MPVYDRSYRRWDGQLSRRGGRWRPIAVAGLRRSLQARATVLRSAALYLFLLGSLVPGLMLFLFNYAYLFPPKDLLPEELFTLLDQLAPFRAAQYPLLLWFCGVLILMWTVLFGSASIAQDRSALALPLYLSRPLTLRDYLTGKFVVVVAMLSVITFLPCLGIWALIVFASEEGWSAPGTFRQLAGILTHCGILVAIHGSGILACSAVCRRPMTAGALWFGIVTAIFLLSGTLWVTLGVDSVNALDVNKAAMTLAYSVLDLSRLEDQPGGTAFLNRMGVRPYAPVGLCLLATVTWIVVGWWAVVRAVHRHHRESQG